MVPMIASSAFNTASQVAMGENWHFVLKKLVNNIRASWLNSNTQEIKKDVLRSQPPRPQDIPTMADFVRKWGGLPSGMLISELSELANVFIDPRRVVSGYFFQTLFGLAFLPTEMQ